MEQRLIDANALKEMLIELLEVIKRNPRMDGYEMCIIASCDTLCQMIDDAPSIWAGDAIDLSLKLLDEHERGMLFEYRNLGCTIDHLRELIQAEQEGRLVVLPEYAICEVCPLCCGDCGSCHITGYPPDPHKCRSVIRAEAEAALVQKGDTHETDPV